MMGVDQQVRDFYAGQSLSKDRAREMLAHARAKRHARRIRQAVGLAAVLLIAVSGLWLSSLLAARDLVDRVAAEVAMNHRKDLSVEVVSSNYSELEAALDKLPFVLEAPRSRQLRGYRLVGGRYCSIQAQLAAQLKVEDAESGVRATLYVTELTSPLAALNGVTRTVDDVMIDIWQQDGLIFALAEAADSP